MEAALNEITALETGGYGMASLKEKNSVAIVPSKNAHDRSSKLTDRDDFIFQLRVVVSAKFQQALYEYEDVAQLIKAKMDANRKWGGLAYDTKLGDEDWFYPDENHPDTGVNMNYTIEYDP